MSGIDSGAGGARHCDLQQAGSSAEGLAPSGTEVSVRRRWSIDAPVPTRLASDATPKDAPPAPLSTYLDARAVAYADDLLHTESPSGCRRTITLSDLDYLPGYRSSTAPSLGENTASESDRGPPGERNGPMGEHLIGP